MTPEMIQSIGIIVGVVSTLIVVCKILKILAVKRVCDTVDRTVDAVKDVFGRES